MNTSEQQLSLRFRLDLPCRAPDGYAKLEPDLLCALTAKGADIMESGVCDPGPWGANLLTNFGGGSPTRYGVACRSFTPYHRRNCGHGKSLNNPAVQGVVAVSDAAQIEKIKLEAAGVPAPKDKLKYWGYHQVLEVHEALESVNDAINALGLVPQGF